MRLDLASSPPAEAAPAAKPPAASRSLDRRADFSAALAAAPGRVHLSAHNHHLWPDVTLAAVQACWRDAVAHADGKWETPVAAASQSVREGIAARLRLPDPGTIALGPNTGEFVRRLLSCLPLPAAAGRPPRVLASDAEFHSFSRQAARLEEEGLIEVERVASRPYATFSDRFLGRVRARARTGEVDLVFVSHVFFDAGAVSLDPADLAAALDGTEVLGVVDGYHGFMALPTDLSRAGDRLFYLAGSYKYAMAGEGACFLHCPPGIAPRPRDTGWVAGHGVPALPGAGVTYAADGRRFAGATADPTGLYRQRAVFVWLDGAGLTVEAIHAHVLSLQEAFVPALEALRIEGLRAADLVTPFMPGVPRGNFLAYAAPRAEAMEAAMARAGIVADRRRDRLRFGFGLYHARGDVPRAVEAIGRALR